MRKNTKKAVCILFAVILFVCSFPFSVFAVDPVSASVIANSFAQAITAYGAANGVSLGFDVSNTNGIGESVHELWTAFRNGTQTADDYDTLAEALFPDLYYKAERALAGAQAASYVGMRITSEYAEEFDNFYNWLLSGPAEMVQVDNQYYEWASSQMGSSSTFLPVYSGYTYTLNGFNVVSLPLSYAAVVGSSVMESQYRAASSTYPSYAYRCSLNGNYTVVIISRANPVAQSRTYYPASPGNSSSWSNISTYVDSASGYNYGYAPGLSDLDSLPTYVVSSSQYKPSVVFGIDSNVPVESDTVGLGVKAYGDAATADFPDTADPNYDALHRARDIPLDTPWDDTLYGDGTGTLTDAQSGAITGTLDDILVAAGEIDISQEGTADPTPPDPDDDPSDDPGDYGVLGLENIFPFCIPFDIYNFLNALAATPTAPHFTATLQLPAALGGAQTIDLDFDNPTFNQLAQLLRLLELLAFIVGLALLTRSMFIRG